MTPGRLASYRRYSGRLAPAMDHLQRLDGLTAERNLSHDAHIGTDR
jgi:hypothetical protein